MAKLETLVPFILYYECGLPKRFTSLPLEQMFAQAKKTGWSNHPNDKGGATQCGITIATYTAFCKAKGRAAPTQKQLRSISLADWLEITKSGYWDKMRADDITSQSVANILVDWAFLAGAPRVAKRLQRILGVTADGKVGPVTLAAINAQKAGELFAKLKQSRVNFFNGIGKGTNSVFLKGWLRRTNAICFGSLNYN